MLCRCKRILEHCGIPVTREELAGSAGEAVRLINQGAVVLDVRTGDEFERLGVLDEIQRARGVGAVADFQAFCRTTGNELVEHSEDGGVYRFLIKKVA